MTPEAERELTHILLVELLAHQFAYPVRWIETQDVILGEKNTERIVEVGPSQTLTNMMKRTWEQGFVEKDAATGNKRNFLGITTDKDAVYYNTSQEEDAEDTHDSLLPRLSEGSTPSVPESVSLSAPPPVSTGTVASPIAQTISSAPAEALADVQVPVECILKTVLFMKLKKRNGDIGMKETIGRLVGGRSALTNEIIGDLHNEFPDLLPDRAEDVALDELCATLTSRYSGTLGKQTKLVVGRMISSKFPPEYSQSQIRQTLSDEWGLGPLRQDAVLLMALEHQPASRLSSSEAQKFVAEMAGKYYLANGLALPSSTSSGSNAGQNTMVDAKTMQLMNEKNATLARDVMEVLQNHVSDSPKTTMPAETVQASDSTQLCDLFVSEHGDEYAEGIVPLFDPKKQRVYDSYWNWNAQDITLLLDLWSGARIMEANEELVETLMLSIVNRACARDIKQLAYASTQLKTKGTGAYEAVIRERLKLLGDSCRLGMNGDPVFIERCLAMAPLTTVSPDGQIEYHEIPRQASSTRLRLETQHPFIVNTFKSRNPVFSPELTAEFALEREAARTSGLSFAGRNILLNGAGRASIGSRMLRYLLEAGARVTVTTSNYSADTNRMYQDLYARYGSRGSVLRVLPFNQGSQNDVKSLVQYLDADPEWDLDYIVPFAAIPENGRGLEDLDSRSELAHRLMFTNLLRLLGGIAKGKRQRNVITRPATVVLPLSPNHGLMGNDGLYSESKRSLEVLLAKWHSESWNEYLSVMGVVIGWTRGTGLMDDNNIVAQGVEAMGVQTFAVDEMAASLVCAMGGRLNAHCQLGPLLVDMGGGMEKVDEFQEELMSIREELNTYADVRRALAEEKKLESQHVHGKSLQDLPERLQVPVRANLKHATLPDLPNYSEEIAPLASSLEGMVDLSRVVVITGFSELGPYGSSRTRWEMETHGTLSLEGCVELAWMMDLVRYQGKSAGWVDTKTGLAINDADIPRRYMEEILEHTGIRLVEPGICDNEYDPENKAALHEVLLQRDMPPFEASAELAHDLRKKHGDKACVTIENDTHLVKLKAGAVVMVPSSSHFNRNVAGQIPTGWSPKRYGISDDIIEQCDPVTLFSLVNAVEALLCSGIVDPYEVYKHIHISEVGNCIGSSMGGLSSLRQMHRDRFIDRTVQADILQETFINTTGAWINMLLFSSSGPLRTPVGACATSLESLDTGYDLIVGKKAKVVLVGGVEDFVEDVSFEFGSMKATCDTDAEAAAGRSPREMSRPTASSRSGFVEAQGGGVQVLTSAELALEMGLPIFGIVALTNMSADKASRSVPAPGKGVLTNAREVQARPGSHTPAATDLGVRRRLLELRRKQIEQSRQEGISMLADQVAMLSSLGSDPEETQQHWREALASIDQEAKDQEIEATYRLGNDFWRAPGPNKKHISPIRGALAVWGLGVDDLSFVSLHGTSTVKNDLNETLVIDEQVRHLGRTKGNLLPCVCQKWLTGHSKGGAGAWMINGALQTLNSGILPGNRNADNVDGALRSREHLYFPNQTLNVAAAAGPMKACSVTSFGFGQKGAQAILVHPRYLFATISRDSYDKYRARRDKRWGLACRAFSEGLVNGTMVSEFVKTDPPYPQEEEMKVLLDPEARF